VEEDLDNTYMEWVVEQDFAEAVEAAGWITVKGDHIQRGLSDRFCFGPRGRVVIVEFKKLNARKKRRGEKLQDYYRKQFRELGFETHKITGMDEMYALKDSLLA
jgi:hypothetical protein